MPVAKMEDVPDLPGYEQCNDCGASTGPGEEPVHYVGCQPGTADYWAKYYQDFADAEDRGEYDDTEGDTP